jgi:hypothetical protein
MLDVSAAMRLSKWLAFSRLRSSVFLLFEVEARGVNNPRWYEVVRCFLG